MSGKARALLTLMNRDGELVHRHLSNVNDNIQVTSDRFKGHLHSEESQVEGPGQLARLHVSGLRIILEPLVEPVTIQPGSCNSITHSSNGKLSIPATDLSEKTHHYLHLRPDDEVHFENEGVWIRYSLQRSQTATPPAPASMPPAISHQDEGVQVKSSDPAGAQQAGQQKLPFDSETEDEGDLGRTTSPVVATPATSRPTATNEIKETPHHEGYQDVNVNEEDAPFSTAFDGQGVTEGDLVSPSKGPSSELVPQGEMDSPTHRAAKQRAGRAERSHEKTSSGRVISFDEGDVDDAHFGRSSARVKTTYKNHSRRNTPQKSDAPEEDRSDVPTVPPTSQALHPEGVTYEAARRSVSGKRKLGSDADEGSPKKARRVISLQSEQEGCQDQPVDEAGAETEDEVEEDAAGAKEVESDYPSQVPAGDRVSSGKLPHVARADSDDDDIAVAPLRKSARRSNSSPEVVVRPHRGSKSASKTPAGTPGTPDSTATSLTGKPPKIIISNVAGTYSAAAALTKFIKSQGSALISSVLTRRANFLCMVKDDEKLSKTPKVLRSLALGKLVVTERWIHESKAAGELLDPRDFVHAEVADTIDMDRRKLFDGVVVFFTNTAVKEYGMDNWEDMKALVTDLGASSVDSGTGFKGGKMTGRNSIVYIGTNDDADATALIQDHSRVVYHKDLVKDAIVAGELDLEDGEHQLAAGKTKKKGRR